jgi:hypothetical protein
MQGRDSLPRCGEETRKKFVLHEEQGPSCHEAGGFGGGCDDGGGVLLLAGYLGLLWPGKAIYMLVNTPN